MGTFIIFRSSDPKFLVSLFGPFIHTVHVSLPPLQALGEACTETQRRVGAGRRENGLHARIGSDREGEGCFVPRCGGTCTEVEDPL